jgi:hypothetical protein
MLKIANYNKYENFEVVEVCSSINYAQRYNSKLGNFNF